MKQEVDVATVTVNAQDSEAMSRGKKKSLKYIEGRKEK